jgi:hypothetical protein
MSATARGFQIVFMVFGFLFLGVGLIGAMASEKSEVAVAWICPTPKPDAYGTSCNTEAHSYIDNGIGVATVFAIVGVGLQVAAASIAAGSRPQALVPVLPPAQPTAARYPTPVPPTMPPTMPPTVPPAAPQSSPPWPSYPPGS